MKKKYRGRKVKHTKRLYVRRKSLPKKILSIAIVIVIIGGLGFVGYSIAPPLIKFFRGLGKDNDDSSSKVWTPPEVSSSQTDSSKNDSSEPDKQTQDTNTLTLKKESLLSEQALKDTLAKAKSSGYLEVAVPLKIQGGELYFKTVNATAVKAKAVKGTLTASQIVSIIKESGLKPVAQLSILNDNLAPRADYQIGYKFENQETMWLDNSPDRGGKPWMSPFSQQAKTYITQLIDELGTAGFTKFITTDYSYPNFLPGDLNYIGAVVKDPNRKNALIAFAQLVKTDVDKYKGQTIIKMSAVDSIAGKSEAFVPASLKGLTISTQIDVATLPPKITLKDNSVIDLSALNIYDRVKTITTKIAQLCGEEKIIPVLNTAGLSQPDIENATKALTDLGYKSFIIA